MCGRFMVDDTVWAEVERLTKWLDRNMLKNGDCFPGQQILVLRKSALKGEFTPCMAHWGYPGYGSGRQLINARSETVRQKPAFRADFEWRRCVIPARGFYEWNSRKEKFYFTGDVPVLYLAGIFSNDPEKECVTILTAQANAAMQPVHDRMPLLIPEKELDRWMADTKWAAQFLRETPPLLKREKEKDDYEQLSLL
ncbi:MAG: SOS response-associated peptidase family protein [Eubacteriales bacterium]|nr:SOS response-associated peptidase family protein [Eubacteriales bacterium]